MQKKEVHIISHTHWDREWYLTFEQFRVRLVKLVDHLLEILEKEPEYRCFMLDGQTVLLKDYLAIKPWNKERIKRYIKEGRILIGPWYVLPDEFLPGGESHIRNLLLGDKLCREFGGKMNEGYLPDSFGHIAQMPQILKGFGIKSAIFWRGVSNKVKTTEFIWEAPDGSRVFTIYWLESFYHLPSLWLLQWSCSSLKFRYLHPESQKSGRKISFLRYYPSSFNYERLRSP